MNPVHFSRRVHVLIFLFIALLLILLCYPITPHQLGADTYLINAYGEVITREGYAPWAVHPLSYFGFYPDSYPAAVPYLLSAVRQVTGMEMETVVYFVSMVFGLLGLTGMYMLSGSLLNDDRFKFLACFAYSTSPLMLKFTNWTISTRGLLLVLLPIFLWLIIKSSRTSGSDKMMYMVSAFLLLLIMAFVHRMFWFSLLILIVYIVVSMLHGTVRRRASYKRYTPEWEAKTNMAIVAMLVATLGTLGLILMNTTLPIIGRGFGGGFWESMVSAKNLVFALIVVGAFVSIFLWMLSGERKRLKMLSSALIVFSCLNLFFIQFTDLAPWQTTWWVRTRITEYAGREISAFPNTLEMLEGLAIEFGARIGLFLIPAVIAIILIPMKSLVDERRIFPIAASMVVFPFLHIAMYFYQAISPLIFVLGSFTLIFLLSQSKEYTGRKKWKRTLVVSLIAIFLVASLIFTAYTVTFRADRGEGDEMANYAKVSEHSAAMYVNEHADSNVVGGGRTMAYIEWDPPLTADKVFITRRQTPELFEFQGWYGFLKQPLRWERIPGELEPQWFISSTEASPGGYTLFSNGARIVWYQPNA